MARIAGVNIPTDKKIFFALRYIYGIGYYNAEKICSALEINANRRVSDLSAEEVVKIREYIDANFKVEGDLRRIVGMNIKRLVDIGCYRGVRHRLKLPVRGQRTHTNAKTRKKVS